MKINSLETLLTSAGQEATQLFTYPIARWSFKCNFVSNGCNIEKKVIDRELKPFCTKC